MSHRTGLPNRQSSDQESAKLFLAICDVDYLRVFKDYYGHLAGDALLRRLADILISFGLNAYRQTGGTFLCDGDSHQELNVKLFQARQILRPRRCTLRRWIEAKFTSRRLLSLSVSGMVGIP